MGLYFCTSMNVSFFDNRRVRQGLTILMLFGALTCIFPPIHPVFHWWAERAVFVALAYLFLGLFFLAINNPRLMFVCLGCSAAISFFKNEMGDASIGPDPAPPLSYPLDTQYKSRIYPDSFYLKPDTPDESSKTR